MAHCYLPYCEHQPCDRQEGVMDIYETLKAAGVPLDNHESDLYAKVTDTSRELVNVAYHRGDFKTVSTFKSQIDGEMWYDIPFAYTPWWEARSAR